MSLEKIPVTQLTGVGPALAKKLASLGILSVQDVLFHLPYRYQDRTQLTPMAALKPGDYAVVEGEVVDVRVIQRRSKILQVSLSDETGVIFIKFFHFVPAQKKRFEAGGRFRFFGQVKGFGFDLSLIHPEMINLNQVSHQHMQESLTPLYSTTEGIGQRVWWQITEQALAILKRRASEISDLYPPEWKEKYPLPELPEALLTLHRPSTEMDQNALLSGTHPAQQRLAAEELLAHHMSLKILRERAKHLAAPSFTRGALAEHFINALPYVLTNAQQRVLKEIFEDLHRANPMQRLVQGDVGSGKTVVAACAAATALENGFQVAYMAPTEILAEQHFKNFSAWFAPFEIEVLSLMGKHSASQKKKLLDRLKDPKPCVVVGTHALFQESVIFTRLGLVIIDEQHRFGVHQRMALLNKGDPNLKPHQLIMTATPIPRTLAMTVYADLDYSVIDELPPGRQGIETRVLSNTKRPELIQKLNEMLKQGHQIYWVCPLIEESEVLQCQAAEQCYEELSLALPKANIGLVHGRQKAKEKEAVMAAFKAGEIDLLVATSVIEVGVDVPNATYMFIENAERLGLSQLHQLRGRVGRGAKQSYCILLYQMPLSELARERLETMRRTQDGFEIAKKDMALRGPGEILGTRQTGLLQLRVADFVRDQVWVERIRSLPSSFFSDEKITQALIARWIGSYAEYGKV